MGEPRLFGIWLRAAIDPNFDLDVSAVAVSAPIGSPCSAELASQCMYMWLAVAYCLRCQYQESAQFSSCSLLIEIECLIFAVADWWPLFKTARSPAARPSLVAGDKRDGDALIWVAARLALLWSILMFNIREWVLRVLPWRGVLRRTTTLRIN